ncbi:MAG TPA: radical SAM protein, partial [Acidobacteriota bacterium]|nr:radical SAM protein [Acidobacteriota bacterium]
KREAIKLNGEIVSIANSSDPYPLLEAKTGLMRKCLETLATSNCRIQIITKSNLVTRDIDLLKKVPSMVSLTVTTDDDRIAKLIEPNAPSPTERLRATKILIDKGIPTSVRTDPIIPTINDSPENLIKTLASIGVKHITASTYKIKLDNWRRFNTAMPKVAEKLKSLYFEQGEKMGRCIYLPKDLRLNLMKNMAILAKDHDMKFGTCRENLSQLNTAACDGSWLLNADA